MDIYHGSYILQDMEMALISVLNYHWPIYLSCCESNYSSKNINFLTLAISYDPKGLRILVYVLDDWYHDIDNMDKSKFIYDLLYESNNQYYDVIKITQIKLAEYMDIRVLDNKDNTYKTLRLKEKDNKVFTAEFINN